MIGSNSWAGIALLTNLMVEVAEVLAAHHASGRTATA
jgi:hypothetical protein